MHRPRRQTLLINARRPVAPVRGARSVSAVLCGLVWLGAIARADDPARQVFITPESAQQSPDFALQGEYAKPGLGLQVVARGDGQFTANLYKGGLPGAGWDGSERQTVDDSTDGIQDLITSLELDPVERRSPTLGLAPPPGAVVLFDGTPECLAAHWQSGARRTDDGLLMQGATTLDTFQDHTLHIEFLTPFMPLARGQGRGNSGVYYQGRYETQVLDSFGLDGKQNETGGIYSIKDPDLNLCLPPLTWQTYDGDFTAARYDADGKLIAPPRLTVRLNDVEVQRDVELPHTTTAAPVRAGPEPGPLYLQDHNNPVRFRNIWVLPRDAAREARRPIVPGFERFHAAAGSDAAAGGRLLLGELACTKCHAPSKAVSSALLVKEPPLLDDVGSRLHPDWMYRYLLSPQDVKPGTTMPGLLETLPESERDAAARALVSFLASTGSLAQTSLEPAAAQRGEKLFHNIGCVQCHAPRSGETVAAGSSVPLVDVGKKYSIPSLAAFLKDPHKVRPSGRMPGWSLNDKQLQDLAAYLVGEVHLRPLAPNLNVQVYHGSWETLPDFEQLTPVATVQSAGFDVGIADRGDRFGLVFNGYLHIEKNGQYTFFLGSDDGSRLLIDGIEIVRNDGIHPHEVVSGTTTKLDAGPRRLRVEYFEGAFDQSLTLEIESKTLTRQDVTPRITLTPDERPGAARVLADGDLEVDPSLAGRGRELFATLGCAACHQRHEGDERIASRVTAKPLAQCDVSAGCLSRNAAANVPQYELAPQQAQAIVAALAGPVPEQAQTARDVIHHTLLAYNCYACHTRDGLGGPASDRQHLFTSTIPEMGDEGRLPPPLSGVGDKLNDEFLKSVLKSGADDRPYMQTQMPRFIARDVVDLAGHFAAVDRRTEAQLAAIDEPLHRIKATGRQLVGDKGLACIKCHTFGPHRATGIQAIDLLAMPRRLRDDWFLRYLVNPNEYRPGTRMPTGFPEGVAVVRDVYHGDPPQQITAIWTYLGDGSKAGIPDGLVTQLVELKPTDAPIIYRNFIDGLSPRGIAVGYPEGCHLAWDANRMALALVWHGRFMDASRHWAGRGQGFEPPLGDDVLRIEETVPLAILPSADAPWPTDDPHEHGYRFRGYRLDARRRPTFSYSGPGFTVSDFAEPVRNDSGAAGFHRHLRIEGADAAAGLYFRAAAGAQIESQADGGWLVDKSLRVSVRGGGTPFVRQSEGRAELLVPVRGGEEVLQELRW